MAKIAYIFNEITRALDMGPSIRRRMSHFILTQLDPCLAIVLDSRLERRTIHFGGELAQIEGVPPLGALLLRYHIPLIAEQRRMAIPRNRTARGNESHFYTGGRHHFRCSHFTLLNSTHSLRVALFGLCAVKRLSSACYLGVI